MILKRTTFYLVASLIPVAVLVMVEVILRVSGVDEERSHPFISLGDSEHHLAFNPAYPTRYFSSFAPSVAFEPFASSKTEDIIRVVTLGGSSAAGFPYSSYNAFPYQLRRRLQHHAFGKQVEVLNLAMTAVNSFTLWDLADEVVDLKPDAVVIYAGHNEFYGAFGVGSTQYGLGESIWPKRLLLALKDFVLFRFLEKLILDVPDANQSIDPDGRTMMARVVAESGIEYGGDIFRSGLRQFESNLSDVLETFSNASIPVYIGTLTSNLRDQPPLGENADAGRDFQQATEAVISQDTVTALRLFRQAADLDEIRFRAPSAINDIIRNLATRHGANLVDVEAAFQAHSRYGIPGAELFDDHLHPNHDGYILVAETFFEGIRSAAFLSEPLLNTEVNWYPPLDPIDRAYAALQIARLRGGYPFTKNVPFEKEREQFDRTVAEFRRRSVFDSLAVLLTAKSLLPAEGLRQGVQLARAAGDTASALAMSFGLMYWQSLNYDLVADLAGYAAQNNHFDDINWLLAMEAFGLTRQTLPLSILSAITLRMHHLEDAEVVLDMVERRDPDNRSMLFNRARLLVLKGDTVAARAYFDRFRNTVGEE